MMDDEASATMRRGKNVLVWQVRNWDSWCRSVVRALPPGNQQKRATDYAGGAGKEQGQHGNEEIRIIHALFLRSGGYLSRWASFPQARTGKQYLTEICRGPVVPLPLRIDE